MVRQLPSRSVSAGRRKKIVDSRVVDPSGSQPLTLGQML